MSSTRYMKIKQKVLANAVPIITTALLLLSFLAGYIYGFNNRSVIISSTFDNLTYTTRDSKYASDRYFNVVELTPEINRGHLRTEQMRLHFEKRHEYINSYIFDGSVSGEKAYNISFSDFQDLQFDLNSITVGVSSDRNHQMELFDLEIYLETSVSGDNRLIYLPSSIAETIIATDSAGIYHSYDDVIEKLEVDIFSNHSGGQQLYSKVKLRNIFYDGKDTGYKGRDKNLGAEMQQFLGTFIVTIVPKLDPSLRPKFAFSTNNSFFSLKDYLGQLASEQSLFQDCRVQVYGLTADGKQLLLDIENLKDFYSQGSENFSDILVLLLGVMSLLAALTIVFIQVLKRYKHGNYSLKDHLYNKTLITKCIRAALISFVGLHFLFVLLFNNNYSVTVLRSINFLGNTHTILITSIFVIALSVLGFVLKKRVNTDE